MRDPVVHDVKRVHRHRDTFVLDFRKLGITSRRQLRDLPLAVGRAD
ncbi:hypothetical protein [Streptomyces roseolus]